MTTSQSQTLPSPVRRWIRRHPIALLLIWFFTVGQALAFAPAACSSSASCTAHS